MTAYFLFCCLALHQGCDLSTIKAKEHATSLYNEQSLDVRKTNLDNLDAIEKSDRYSRVPANRATMATDMTTRPLSQHDDHRNVSTACLVDGKIG